MRSGGISIVAGCFSTVNVFRASAAMPSSCNSAGDGGRMLNVSRLTPSFRSAATSRLMNVCDVAGYWLVR